MMTDKWNVGERIVAIEDNRVGVIAEEAMDDDCVYVEWEDGEYELIEKDKVKRI